MTVFRSWSSMAVLALAGCLGGNGVSDNSAPGSDRADRASPAGAASPAGSAGPAGAGGEDTFPDGVSIELDSAELEGEVAALRQELTALEGLDAQGLMARHPLSVEEDLGYDPAEAQNLDLIQASAVALDEAELERLMRDGFAISAGQAFPTFGYGYVTLYAEHLPLYVSLDSVLEAVHRAYDTVLLAIEEASLIPELGVLLDEMRAELAQDAVLPDEVRHDLDFYLSVAKSLLDGRAAAPVAGADAEDVAAFLSDVRSEQGFVYRELFGVRRRFDFSQFTPRGHYTDTEELERYFRAMMWLGRIDFRMIETDDFGNPLFRRRQLEAALAIDALLTDRARQAFERIDAVIEGFVGESDYMKVPELSLLMADLGASSVADVAALDDATIANAIYDGGYGAQRICSHIMIKRINGDTFPLNRSFLIFGQRYVVDSHVFSNLVFDRIDHTVEKRMMPDPLDVAYAALGNDQAAQLLVEELDRYKYAGDLEAMRLLVDEHEPGFWQASLYNEWLSSLRGMSPAVAAPAEGESLPRVMQTEAWGRRVLNTQLASWAELRHDTLLYAKQSYTMGVACDFPDGYVDPYPEAWAALERFAQRGQELAAALDFGSAHYITDSVQDYFVQLEGIVGTLREMSAYVRAGTPFTERHLAFINETVDLIEGCGGPEAVSGWYARLHYEPSTTIDFDPVIADVHTQPTDEVGNPVGRILHVGTGLPRLMVVTADTCQGPRAYAGLVSSYHERITENFGRLTDERWARGFDAYGRGQIQGEPPAEVSWMRDLLQ